MTTIPNNNQLGTIDIVRLVKNFGQQQILKGISLRIAPKERFVIMGLSGSGKSVLLKHLVGLHKPDQGDIYVDGQNIVNMDHHAWQAYLKRVGMVFQDAALFDSMTVGQNIAFPLHEHTNFSTKQIEERVDYLLECVRVYHAKTKNPAHLSGGMRKRVGIARALALKPEFVYYDEPTSGLDPVTAHIIEDLILETQTDFGYTSIIITHHWELAERLATRVVLLWKGRVQALGTPAELKAMPDDIVQGFLKHDPAILARD